MASLGEKSRGSTAGDDTPDDLASLPSLDDTSVVEGVRMRFQAGKMYTRINTLLVAMNPYQWLKIYGEEVMRQYAAATPGTLPPHVYGTAAAAFSGLVGGNSQSIVISGESGAGKSETAKKVLQHVAFAAARGDSHANDNTEAKILASAPILEAWGNAKTSMNHNSSRYGKFLMLQFDLSGKLVGAHVKTYLLEKTRVIQQGQNERGYHVGYMLCGDADGYKYKVPAEPPSSAASELCLRGCRAAPSAHASGLCAGARRVGARVPGAHRLAHVARLGRRRGDGPVYAQPQPNTRHQLAPRARSLLIGRLARRTSPQAARRWSRWA